MLMELSFAQLSTPLIQRVAPATCIHSLSRRPLRVFHAVKSRVCTNAHTRIVPRSVATSMNNVVDELLESVKESDGGAVTSDEERSRIDAMVHQLIDAGSGQRAMTDPRLPGNYNVAYTSSDKRTYSPAGGRFRGAIGRKLFRGRGIFQHILLPSTVVNLVAFRLLGVLKGSVGLRGVLELLPDSEMGENGIKVRFEKPRIALGSRVFEFSQPSEVRLRIAYLDERVRIGVGSRGSLFVFTRGGLAESPVADEWMMLFGDETRAVPALPFFAATIAALVALGAAFASLARALF